MGSRTNYTIITTKNPLQNINLYSHWDGDESVEILRRALIEAMPRLGDNSYFVRILINALQSNHDSETGYGIYVGEVDHEESYDYKEVNLINKTIAINNMRYSIKDFVEYQGVKELQLF